jgi:ATP-dependent helicase/nuclease subunit A
MTAMTSQPDDQGARDRFTRDWWVNFAVVANAGSGKTTAISERLAEMALAENGAKLLEWTAVVTYTKKAAAEIEQRARTVLRRRLASSGGADARPLAVLDRAFFGTIHSFCLLLARRHGSPLGVHLNPVLIDQDDDSHWREFLEQDPMTFTSLEAAQADAFLRHVSLDEIFDLAKGLDKATAGRLMEARPGPRPSPSQAVLDEILATVPSRKGPGALALARNKERAREWMRRLGADAGRLPIPRPEGGASGIVELYGRLFAPLKGWLAQAGGVLAAELSLRYRTWRAERGVQSYADQIETALEVVRNTSMLEAIRAQGWRVLLDEAQDTDPDQFSVLVEIARPPGARTGTWPARGGAAPRPGHFCMVGDAQQGIYSDRADIRNFNDHVAAFGAGLGGERLTFHVTFRAPGRVVSLLNKTLPPAFGPGRDFNFGVPAAEGAAPPFLQASYEPLVAGPGNAEGAAWRMPIRFSPVSGSRDVGDKKLADEARQLARLLSEGGPESVGAERWGEICILAPRRAWLPIISDELREAGLKTALQMKRNRAGDNPVYAWVSGLMAVVCDPDNAFEWVGVLREIFCVSDAEIASALRGGAFSWAEAGDHPGPIAGAIGTLTPFIDRADADGESLGRFSAELCAACGLAAKARLADPSGGHEDELERLLARAAELGAKGAGPRGWLRDLLGSVDEFRSPGRPAGDAINLITSHSAKGLEWPVVIPAGLWRPIGHRPEHGMRIVRDRDGGARVVFDNEGVGERTRMSLDREQQRNTVRLLYVTLTRAKKALVLPWPEEPPEEDSFGEIWGLDPGALDPIPGRPKAPASPGAPAEPAPPQGAPEASGAGSPAPAFPRRILPHQLASPPDLARASLHESAADAPLPAREFALDPLDYGLWWHETLEFMPWEGDEAAVGAYGDASLAKAEAMGFGQRGREEWDRFLGSEPCRLIREPRWNRLAEAGIFAPLSPGEWIDGVIDLVLHDPGTKEIWIVDWKTNRRRAGEGDEALLGRLVEEYRGQLSAYGRSAAGFFEGGRTSLWVYSTAAGRWAAVGEPA